MNHPKNLRVAVLSAALVATSLAHAAVLSTESFSGYTTGEIPFTTSPAVTGYTGNWTDVDFGNGEPSVTVGSGSLIYSDPLYLGSTGDKAEFPSHVGVDNVNQVGRVYRLLDSSLAVTASTTGTVYLSFLYQNTNNTALGYQMLDLYNGNTADANRSFTAGITDNGPLNGDQYGFGANEAYTSTGVTATNAVRLFVVKFDLSATAGSDSVTVWLDPILGANDPTGGVTVTGKNMVFDRLALSNYDNANGVAWDEIRWGTDFNSVTIPEPASALLGSFGVLALLRRRRN